jgi:DNA primase
MAGDPIELIRDLHTEPMKYLTGTKQIEVARNKIRSLVAKVDIELAKQRPLALAQINSPEYRESVRRQLAGQIRQDPTALARAQDAVRIQQQAQATLAQATAPFDVSTSTDASVAQAEKVSSTGGLLSFAAIVGYFLLHK